MRFIPTKFHAPLDYIVAAALIAAPWIFQFSERKAATVVPIVLGIGLIAYSLVTNYELGVWKIAPMAVHNLIDIAAGALLAASPWIFGFAMSRRTCGCPTSSSASRPSSSASPRSRPAATAIAGRSRAPASRSWLRAAPHLGGAARATSLLGRSGASGEPPMYYGGSTE
jgi:hypothetical protein